LINFNRDFFFGILNFEKIDLSSADPDFSLRDFEKFFINSRFYEPKPFDRDDIFIDKLISFVCGAENCSNVNVGKNWLFCG